MTKYDLIVIGCGGIGSAALYAASQRGLKTLGIDQFELGHTKGSTHGETRAFRLIYSEAPHYIPLLQQAYTAWQELEKLSKKKLFVENGVIEIGFPNRPEIKSVLNNASKYHLSVENLDADQINKRFPEFSLQSGMIGVYQKQAGFLYVEECVRQFVKLASKAGSEISPQEKVLSWDVDTSGLVHVKTNKSSYLSHHLIITAGSWSSQMLNDLNLPLRLLQKKLIWVRAEEKKYETIQTPCFAYFLPKDIFYGFPAISGYVKVARHTGGLELKNPEEKSDVDNRESKAIRNFINTYLRHVSLADTKEANCLYTITPDRNFIIDNHPHYPQVAFAAGLSGHGYKMSNVLGSILVDLVTQTDLSFDISFLSLKRFSK